MSGPTPRRKRRYDAGLAFVVNTQTSTGSVAVTPSEVQGCTGVSRRYACELTEATGSDVDGVQVREERQIQTGSGVEQKPTALLVDCDQAHTAGDGLGRFTAAEGPTGAVAVRDRRRSGIDPLDGGRCE